MLKVSTVLSSCIALSVVAVGVGFSNSPQLLAQNTPPKKIAFQAPFQSQRHLQVSLSRREVTVYQGGVRVNRYPIAIGRPGMETPTGTFQVAKMLEKPAWENPWTGKLIAANDKSNPLGPYFIGFFNKEGTWYGFHGTNEPNSIGKAKSHGCLRMYNEDVEKLFSQVTFGTVVTIAK